MLTSRKDYLVLLVGDIILFTFALWATLAVRYFELPSTDFFLLHFKPFLLLFGVWLLVFLFAGLYERHTRLFRDTLPSVIFYTQTLNIGIAVLFFFLVPSFGIAPKTILAIYLVVSSILIYGWRVYLFPLVRTRRQTPALFIGRGDVLAELTAEIEHDTHHPLSVAEVIDTKKAEMPEMVQRLCHLTDPSSPVMAAVIDASDESMSVVLPLLYDCAFRKEQFALLDIRDVYEDTFERVPLKLVRYESILAHVSRPFSYDSAKRVLDVIVGCVGSLFTFLLVYPVIALLIKLEDGGEVLIRTERVGQYQKPVKLIKFRSMTGNDEGKYNKAGKTELTVTRIGKIIRKLHIDEFPQFWNLLKGDVSFVGPRPELPVLAAEYAARIPYYNARHLIKPGLAGWARLRHKKDPHHGTDVVETKMKLAYDLYYLRHRSFTFDMHIVLQTVKFLFTARGVA